MPSILTFGAPSRERAGEAARKALHVQRPLAMLPSGRPEDVIAHKLSVLKGPA